MSTSAWSEFVGYKSQVPASPKKSSQGEELVKTQKLTCCRKGHLWNATAGLLKPGHETTHLILRHKSNF